MDTKTKLVCLELVGGIFGWIWILASVATLYYLAVAIFSDSPWSRFFWALGISIIAKRLAKGLRDTQLRVGYVAELMAKGISQEEANKEWFDRYVGKKT